MTVIEYVWIKLFGDRTISVNRTKILLATLPYVAGILVCTSALPRIYDICMHFELAANESIWRNIFLVAGNGAWTAFGLATRTLPISLMCAFGTAGNGIVLMLAVWVQFVSH